MKSFVSSVLILVLMEDTLWDKKKFGSKIQKPVLILVLMEDTLWEKEQAVTENKEVS